ncbi:MAG: prohibitin family protein [Candidatus Entotheonellia bacterium]
MGTLILAGIFLLIAVGSYFATRRLTSSVLPAQRDSTAQRAATMGRVVFIGGLALAALTVLWSTFRVIPAGHVGVATFFGKVQKEPLREGLNVIHPLLSVTTMSTQVQKRQARYDAASKDLQAVHVEMVLNYRLLPDRAPEVYQKIGTEYANIIVDPAAQEALKANTALHIASEILRLRPKIKSEVQANLMEWLDKYGIELKEVALANIEFDPSYQKAIEAKQIEEQKAEQKLYELVQAQRQAEIAAAQAKGQGEAARARAEGEAAATRLRADAEEFYNVKVSSSLSPVLINQMYMQKWNGVLPLYMLGEHANVLMPLPKAEQAVLPSSSQR